MILLEPGNRILAETVSAQFFRDANNEEKRDAIDVRLCDFDDVAYRVTIEKENRSQMRISFSAPWWNQIKDNGGQEALDKHYKDMVTDPEQGYDVSLLLNLDSPSGKPEEIVQKVSLLKSNLLGGVFDFFCSNVLKGGKGSSFRFKLRSDTEIFFIPANERVTVIYSLDFREKVDRAVAKVFMQEFLNERKTIGAAPPLQWNTNPPAELKEFGITEPVPGLLGFATFPILKSHVEKEKKEKAIAVLQNFRTYLQYHIKCSKSFFHQRMRLRVKELLLVLNRAKQEPLQEAQKKTITGRTFTRAI
jgi:actin related protein 2/3 complex subunit 2